MATMFSKELEEVIEAALADGVLTDKERAVLQKRAQAEGVDSDELDVVIEGRLAKKKKEEDWLRPAPPRAAESSKVGNVKKCPNCGAQYQPGTGKCPECGHLFQNMEGNSSAQKMAEGIQHIMDENVALLDVFNIGRFKKMERFISDFPIPNTKDDMLEFIMSLDSKRKMRDSNGLQSAYNAKYKEVIKKAKIYFAGDQQVESAIRMTDKFSLATITVLQWAIIAWVAILFLLIFCFI